MQAEEFERFANTLDGIDPRFFQVSRFVHGCRRAEDLCSAIVCPGYRGCIYTEVEADDWNCFIKQDFELLSGWAKQRSGFRNRSELQLRVVGRESFAEALSWVRFLIILLRAWVEEIDVERTIRERTNLPDCRPQASWRRASGTEAPKPTCTVDCGHEFWSGGTRHRCLEYGVLNIEEI